MSLDLLAIQDNITSRLNQLAQDVYESEAPEDSKLRFDANGMILPYIVVIYSDVYDSADSSGILSTKYDTKDSYVDVVCVAPTERSSRQVAQLVRDKLLGYVPINSGEMKIDGNRRYTIKDAKPNRFASELSFVYPVNIVW
jgi:hypothetical protein